MLLIFLEILDKPPSPSSGILTDKMGALQGLEQETIRPSYEIFYHKLYTMKNLLWNIDSFWKEALYEQFES